MHTSATFRLWRDFAVVVGLTACIQLALYWPSFTGTGVLLPVHILTRPGMYLPQDLNGDLVPNYGRSDLVQVSEPHRWFIAAEYRAGRIPLWTPYAFAGTPLGRASIFSPFELLNVLWPGPRVLPWIQLATALVAASGAWRFAASTLMLNSTASVTAGLAWPLTGFLTLWQGYDLSYPVIFLPWQTMAALHVLESPSVRKIIVLATITALTLISGPVDIAGQVLLVTGCIWLWHLAASWLKSRRFSAFIRPAAATCLGWCLGFMLAGPALLPTLDYVRTGARLASRTEGHEARPPVGWQAIPLVLFPEFYGTECDDSVFVLPQSGIRLESAAGAYAGVIALLLAVPFAWRDQTRRSWFWCLIAVAVFGIGWQLNMPILVSLWRLPGLKMLSASRFVFATSWAILSLAAIGLQQLCVHRIGENRRMIHAGLFLTILCIGVWCVAAMMWPTELRRLVPDGLPGLSLAQLQSRFLAPYWLQLGWLTATLVLFVTLLRNWGQNHWRACSIGALMVLELVTHVWNLHPQPDPKLYYPRLPALEYIQRSTPGRVLGISCLPPKLLESHQLCDIRGYDGVDPLPMMQLLAIAADKQTPTIEYARSMWYFPAIAEPSEPDEPFRLHPVLDMLGVKYLVFAQPVELPGPAFNGDGYMVFINQRAIPRAWVPTQVTKLPTPEAIFHAMTPWSFSSDKQAFVTALPIVLPAVCSGEVEIVDENPQMLSLSAKMQSPGLVVVGDRYDAGWQVTVDGQPAPLLTVNYLLRGVVVPEGHHTITMHYQPSSFKWGVRLFFVAATLLALLGCSAFRPARIFYS